MDDFQQLQPFVPLVWLQINTPTAGIEVYIQTVFKKAGTIQNSPFDFTLTFLLQRIL